MATATSYLFRTAASTAPADVSGCTAWPANTFAGRAAVIERGGCEFGVKVLNAQQAGATFAVVYNNAAGGEALTTMGPGAVGNQVTISSIFVPRSLGLGMVAWYTTHGAASRLTVNTVAFQSGNAPDVVASFSSRGPGVGNVLKPDIAAPGVNILSQGYTPGAAGEARHLGFGEVSGTSMAAPHVSGAAALLRQIHPDWSNAYIKSALMSTAKYTEIYLDDARTIPAQPLDIGAGRLDLSHAADPGVILSPPSLSFGLMEQGSTKSIAVTLTSVSSVAETYKVSTLFTGDGFAATKPLPGFSVSPASVTLRPGEHKTVTVTFNSATGSGLGDKQGYIIFDGPTHDAHAPAWARVIAAEAPADVLLIDYDLSSAHPDFADYRDFYTRALTALGYTYDVSDVDPPAVGASVLPPAHTLLGYNTIVLFTGDNFSPIMPGTDIDRLTEFANNGGFVIAMGQDLAAALRADTSSPPFFYDAVLDAEWLQDSVTAEALPALLVGSAAHAPPAFKDLVLNLSGSAALDGADNQHYIDELEPPEADTSPVVPGEQAGAISLLRYPGPHNHADGIVAVARRDQPSLENPGISYLGQSIYTSFGLEGVNNVAGATSRENLLRTFFNWAKDRPAATIVQTKSGDPSKSAAFQATVTSLVKPTSGVSYRWDFGDGTPIAGPQASSQSQHSYKFCGAYTVRVEVADAYGHRAIGSLLASVDQGCEPRRVFLPLIAK
jgi:hypothetical protein